MKWSHLRESMIDTGINMLVEKCQKDPFLKAVCQFWISGEDSCIGTEVDWPKYPIDGTVSCRRLIADVECSNDVLFVPIVHISKSAHTIRISGMWFSSLVFRSGFFVVFAAESQSAVYHNNGKKRYIKLSDVGARLVLSKKWKRNHNLS